MRTVATDAHAELSQLNVIFERGEVMLEMQVPARPGDLRRIVAACIGSLWVLPFRAGHA
jgi:hypothetical protein